MSSKYFRELRVYKLAEQLGDEIWKIVDPDFSQTLKKRWQKTARMYIKQAFQQL